MVVLPQILNFSPAPHSVRRGVRRAGRGGAGPRASAAPWLPAGRRQAAGPAAMGSAQRKAQGAKAEGKERRRDPADPKDTAEEGGQRPEQQQGEGEADGYSDGEGARGSPAAQQPPGAHGDGATSLPPAAAELKREGNELFKGGQFAEAVIRYSEAIEHVVGLGECDTFYLKLM